METVGLGLYWNELELGQQFRTIGRTITEPDIVNFIGCTGMLEVLFTDMEYLKAHGLPTLDFITLGALYENTAEILLTSVLAPAFLFQS